MRAYTEHLHSAPLPADVIARACMAFGRLTGALELLKSMLFTVAMPPDWRCVSFT